MRLNEFLHTDNINGSDEFNKKADEIHELYSWKYANVAIDQETFLYRGSNRKIKYYEEMKKDVNTERFPQAMPPIAHKILNEEFIKGFGWPVRNGLFTTSDKEHAGGFGTPYMFFPIDDNFKFVWSVDIDDLNIWISESITFNTFHDDFARKHYKWKNKEDLPEEYIDLLESIPEHYISINLKSAIESGNEVIFNCNKYLLVNPLLEDYIIS